MAEDAAPPSDVKHYKLLIGTATQSGYCHAGYTLSLVKTFNLISRVPNIKLTHKFILNDRLISRTRNELAAFALSDPTVTHLLLIDAEVGWDPKHIIKLLANNKPICAATCAKRGYRWDRLKSAKMKELMNQDESDEAFRAKIKAHLVDYNVNFGPSRRVDDGVMEVEEIGSEFMLIERGVFEKIAATRPELKLSDNNLGMDAQTQEHFYCFFEAGIQNGIQYSEDTGFCKKWRNLGGKIHADLSFNLSHYGIEEYQGNMMDISVLHKR